MSTPGHQPGTVHTTVYWHDPTIEPGRCRSITGTVRQISDHRGWVWLTTATILGTDGAIDSQEQYGSALSRAAAQNRATQAAHSIAAVLNGQSPIPAAHHRDDYLADFAAVGLDPDRLGPASSMLDAVTTGCPDCQTPLAAQVVDSPEAAIAYLAVGSKSYGWMALRSPADADLYCSDRLVQYWTDMNQSSLPLIAAAFADLPHDQQTGLINDATSIITATAAELTAAVGNTGQGLTSTQAATGHTADIGAAPYLIAVYTSAIDSHDDHQWEAPTRRWVAALDALGGPDDDQLSCLPDGDRPCGSGWQAHTVTATAEITADAVSVLTLAIDPGYRAQWMHQCTQFLSASLPPDYEGPDPARTAADLLRMLADEIDPRAHPHTP